MKSIIAQCVDCGAERTFRGNTTRTIAQAIDAADWHDGPREDSRGIEFRCPNCYEEWVHDLEDNLT